MQVFDKSHIVFMHNYENTKAMVERTNASKPELLAPHFNLSYFPFLSCERH